MVEKSCLLCGKKYSVIIAKATKSKFCSRLCRDINNIKPKLPRVIKPKLPKKHYFCSLCKIIEVNRKTKYCKVCRKNRNLIDVNCGICDKGFKIYKSTKLKSNHHYCSKLCLYKSVKLRQKGNKSWLWKGGLTDENRLLRNSSDVKNWRSSVFERDNYTCCSCGKHSSVLPKSSLTADHIKPWSLFPELRFNIDNGRTLCIECHKKTDTWGYKSIYKKIK